MQLRSLMTAIAFASVPTLALAADETKERVIDYGFAPEPVTEPTELVERETLEPRTEAQERAIEWRLKHPQTQVEERFILEWKDPRSEHTEKERVLRDSGGISPELPLRAMPVDSEQRGEPDRATR